MRRVLETRRRADGITLRRYADEFGQRFTTYEIPAEILNSFCKYRYFEKYLGLYQRRTERQEAKAKCLEMDKLGHGVDDIAKTLGLSVRTVNRWRQQERETKPSKSGFPRSRASKGFATDHLSTFKW